MATREPEGIATVQAYKQALLALRDKNLPDSHLAMLRAQCRAPSASISATELAAAAGYENYNAANLQYGTLAYNIARLIGYTPQQRPDGTPMWWTSLSYSDESAADADTGHFQFIMRPELASALREMRWA